MEKHGSCGCKAFPDPAKFTQLSKLFPPIITFFLLPCAILKPGSRHKSLNRMQGTPHLCSGGVIDRGQILSPAYDVRCKIRVTMLGQPYGNFFVGKSGRAVSSFFLCSLFRSCCKDLCILPAYFFEHISLIINPSLHQSLWSDRRYLVEFISCSRCTAAWPVGLVLLMFELECERCV